jgi:hypothetical protein
MTRIRRKSFHNSFFINCRLITALESYEQRYLSGVNRNELLSAIHAIWDNRLTDAKSILDSIRKTDSTLESLPSLDDFVSLLQFYLEYPEQLKRA